MQTMRIATRAVLWSVSVQREKRVEGQRALDRWADSISDVWCHPRPLSPLHPTFVERQRSAVKRQHACVRR